jgi:hypothetical protein
LSKRGQASPRVVFVAHIEHADAPHPLALLRPRRNRPSRRTAEERDEVAAFHGHPLKVQDQFFITILLTLCV